MKPQPETVTVVVLNDGETFTHIHGCSIIVVPLSQYEEIQDSGKSAGAFRPIVEIALSDVTPPQKGIDQ